jgi:hypothetical protein
MRGTIVADGKIPLDWGEWHDGVDIYIAVDVTEPLTDSQLLSLDSLAQQWVRDGFNGEWRDGWGEGGFHDTKTELHVDGLRVRFQVDGGSSDLERAIRALHQRLTAWSKQDRVAVRQLVAGQDADDEVWWQAFYERA